jgi:hypothetical protein
VTAAVLAGPHVERAYGVRIERREDFYFRLIRKPIVDLAAAEANP